MLAEHERVLEHLNVRNWQQLTALLAVIGSEE
jgi:hypothetical protein